MPPPTPIACTLTPGDFADRFAWIADLNRDALRSHRQRGTTLELVYAPHAAARLAELVRRERSCCAFLHFTVGETAGAVRLTVEAPDEARDAAGPLFEPFLVGAPAHAGGEPALALTVSSPADASACDGAECGCAGPGAPATDVVAADPSTGPAGGARVAGAAAVTTATAAVACGVCCVLPPAFPALGLMGLGGVVAAFAGAYPGRSWPRSRSSLPAGFGSAGRASAPDAGRGRRRSARWSRPR